jgi:hypothetical protein
VVVSVPTAGAAGDVGDEGPFGAARDVGPGVAEGTISVAASDVAVMNVGHVINPGADGLHGETMTTPVNERQTVGHGWVTYSSVVDGVCLVLWPRETV